jgi:hypothetical protein
MAAPLPMSFLTASKWPLSQQMWSNVFPFTTGALMSPGPASFSFGQCYKTFYGRKFRIFVIS